MPVDRAMVLALEGKRREANALLDSLQGRSGCRSPEEFWKATPDAISERSRKEDCTGGLNHGIETVGSQLAAHFPFGAAGHTDQVPNSVDVS